MADRYRQRPAAGAPVLRPAVPGAARRAALAPATCGVAPPTTHGCSCDLDSARALGEPGQHSLRSSHRAHPRLLARIARGGDAAVRDHVALFCVDGPREPEEVLARPLEVRPSIRASRLVRPGRTFGRCSCLPRSIDDPAMLAQLIAVLGPNLSWLLPGAAVLVVIVFPMPRRGPNSSSRDVWRGFKYAPRQAVLSRAGGRCEGAVFVAWGRCSSAAVQVDHGFPWSRGGPTVVSNGRRCAPSTTAPRAP